MVSIHNDGIQPLILKQRDLSCNLNYNDGHYCKIANLVAGGYLSSVYRFAPKPVIQFLGYTVLSRYWQHRMVARGRESVSKKASRFENDYETISFKPKSRFVHAHRAGKSSEKSTASSQNQTPRQTATQPPSPFFVCALVSCVWPVCAFIDNALHHRGYSHM